MNQYAPCPRCRQSAAEKVNFTWWGGLLGPKLFTHVKCLGCGNKYNGKSGKDNTTNIVIYSVIVGIICFVFVFAIFIALAILSR
jgi:predicted nucleic-acid-binding Zn-ribbon protein